MEHRIFRRLVKPSGRGLLLACFPFLCAFLALPLAAQQVGPLPGATPQLAPAPQPEQSPPPRPAPSTNAPVAEHQSSGITKDPPPSIPPDQIIQRFAQHESEFKAERDNFTYTQTFVVQSIDDSGRPDGQYRMTSDITFTPDGKRYEDVTDAPPPTLERVSLSEEDFNDLRNIQPFVLTTDDLPKYNIAYVGREKVDQIGTYVFDVAPKVIEKKQRYFQGRVWVDDRDLEIVKTYGKAVPDIHTKWEDDVFPHFTTYRENIEGHYWFPTFTHSDEVIHFRKADDVHMRMTVRYFNYRRFRSSARIVPGSQVPVTEAPQPPPPPPPKP